MLGSLALLPLIDPTGVELSRLLIIPIQLGVNGLLHVREQTQGRDARLT
jgi:hypothetical protein